MTLFDKALIFAIEAHGGMFRRSEKIPYIIHPMEVATIVSSMSKDQDLLSAAVLHDIVEDTKYTSEDISSRFGSRVAELVASETEGEYPELPRKESWEIRKKETLEILRTTKDTDIKKLWLGDKLSNMRSFYRLYAEDAENMWNAFNQKDVGKQKWYYTSIREYLKELSDYPAWQEYSALVNRVFGDSSEEN